jgi:hypothetical protein
MVKLQHDIEDVIINIILEGIYEHPGTSELFDHLSSIILKTLSSASQINLTSDPHFT